MILLNVMLPKRGIYIIIRDSNTDLGYGIKDAHSTRCNGTGQKIMKNRSITVKGE